MNERRAHQLCLPYTCAFSLARREARRQGGGLPPAPPRPPPPPPRAPRPRRPPPRSPPRPPRRPPPPGRQAGPQPPARPPGRRPPPQEARSPPVEMLGVHLGACPRFGRLALVLAVVPEASGEVPGLFRVPRPGVRRCQRGRRTLRPRAHRGATGPSPGAFAQRVRIADPDGHRLAHPLRHRDALRERQQRPEPPSATIAASLPGAGCSRLEGLMPVQVAGK